MVVAVPKPQTCQRQYPATLPMKPGMPRRQTTNYQRHGTTGFLAALATGQGVVRNHYIERHHRRESLSSLKAPQRKCPSSYM
jgi:hypothetical protein